MVNHSQFSGRFYFDPKDRIYNDHFPGNPVVPGSIIVQAFCEALQGIEALKGRVHIENFKFKTFIAPGEYSYDISLEPGRIFCRLYNGKTIVTTGAFVR